MRDLLYITGPIRIGKTLLARALAERLRAEGKTVHVFDDFAPTPAVLAELERERARNDLVIFVHRDLNKRQLDKLPNEGRTIDLTPRAGKEAAPDAQR